MANFGPDRACSSFADSFSDLALFGHQGASVDVRFDSQMAPRVARVAFTGEH